MGDTRCVHNARTDAPSLQLTWGGIMSGFFRRAAHVAVCIASALSVSGCGSSGDTPSAPATPVAEASPAPPSHNYSDRIKGAYYYVGSVSDNDKANGQASGSAVGFKFFGKNGNDEYVLGAVMDGGGVGPRFYCHNPCSVVRSSLGTTNGFSAGSLIGAAFTDAFNGQLEQVGRSHHGGVE